MKRFIALGVAAFAFAGTAAAIDDPVNAAPVAPAAAAGNSVDDYFARYDTNRDGVVDWNEARVDPELVRAFTEADADHDGALTRAEFQDAAKIAVRDRNSAAGR